MGGKRRRVRPMPLGSEGFPYHPTAGSTPEGKLCRRVLHRHGCRDGGTHRYPQDPQLGYRASFLAATVFFMVVFKPVRHGTDARLPTHR